MKTAKNFSLKFFIYRGIPIYVAIILYAYSLDVEGCLSHSIDVLSINVVYIIYSLCYDSSIPGSVQAPNVTGSHDGSPVYWASKNQMCSASISNRISLVLKQVSTFSKLQKTLH